MAPSIRATQITGKGTFDFVSIDSPAAGHGEVLVRPLHLAICGSDIFVLHHRKHPSFPLLPGTSGHEMVGVVESVGEGVTSIEVGSVALVLAPDHNAMAERFVALPEWIFPLPTRRSNIEYLMAQQLGTVIYTSRRLPSVIGAKVAIIGQGSVGLFFLALLRRLGAETIICMDVVRDRLEFSRAFGADLAFDNSSSDPVVAVTEATGGEMADIEIEAAGEVSSINLAPSLVKTRGNIVFFGIPHEERFEFDYWTFFRKFANTITSSGAMQEPGGGSFRLAMDLIDSGAIDVSSMVTHRFPFTRVGEAYELARTKSDGALKVVVDMPGG